MPRVLMAGLPSELTSWLAQRLPGVSVLSTNDGQETLNELAKSEWSLLIIDHRVSGPAASEVVERAWSGLGTSSLQVMYCMEPGMTGEVPEGMAQRLGVGRLLFHPIDREEIALMATKTLRLLPELSNTVGSERQRTTFATLTRIWSQIRETVLGRLEVLEQAAAALLRGGLREEQREEAEREAHKLGGLVGTFGFLEGTRFARKMEQMLEAGSSLGQAEALSLSELVVALRKELEQPLHLEVRTKPDDKNELP